MNEKSWWKSTLTSSFNFKKSFLDGHILKTYEYYMFMFLIDSRFENSFSFLSLLNMMKNIWQNQNNKCILFTEKINIFLLVSFINENFIHSFIHSWSWFSSSFSFNSNRFELKNCFKKKKKNLFTFCLFVCLTKLTKILYPFRGSFFRYTCITAAAKSNEKIWTKFFQRSENIDLCLHVIKKNISPSANLNIWKKIV